MISTQAGSPVVILRTKGMPIENMAILGYLIAKLPKVPPNIAAAAYFVRAVTNILMVFPNAKYYKQSDLIVFIISPAKFERAQLEAQLQMIFSSIRDGIANKVAFTITMGVGEYVKNIKDIHLSYGQARTSINLGYQLEKFDCILFYNKLGIYRLLATTVDTEEYQDFIERSVKPLLEYDSRSRACLMETLEAIIRCGWNLKNASAELFVHYNSVKYRFAKICEVLDIDLKDHEQKLAVEIALKMYIVSNQRWT